MSDKSKQRVILLVKYQKKKEYNQKRVSVESNKKQNKCSYLKKRFLCQRENIRNREKNISYLQSYVNKFVY